MSSENNNKADVSAAERNQDESAGGNSKENASNEAVYDLSMTAYDDESSDSGFVFLDDASEDNDGTEIRSADEDSARQWFTTDQLHDIQVFINAMNGLFKLVANADYTDQVKFIRQNISVLRTIAHNSTGLLAYDEREKDDEIYASSLVMRWSCGIPLEEDLADNYGELGVWNYIPE